MLAGKAIFTRANTFENCVTLFQRVPAKVGILDAHDATNANLCQAKLMPVLSDGDFQKTIIN